MKVRFYSSNGYVGATKYKEVDIDLEDLEGLDQAQIDDYLFEVVEDIQSELVELGWEGDITPELVAEELKKEQSA